MSIRSFNHIAFRCTDTDKTIAFYRDLLGLPLAWAVSSDKVGSIGAHDPHLHIFFELPDGSCIAFFDLLEHDDPIPDPNTPDWVQHIAFSVDGEEELLAAKGRLESAGVEVVGPKYGSRFNSIYFFDPNGHRLELSYQSKPFADSDSRDAAGVVAKWNTRKGASAEVR